jgi:magnesium transporter
VWLGLYEPTDEELDAAARAFGIHPLAVEDARLHDERPKVDLVGDTLTVVLRPARYVDDTESVEFGQITMMCSPEHIVVVRHGDAVPLTQLRARLEAQPERLRLGPGAVLHEVLDTVVEAYVPVHVGISNDIDEVEEQVFTEGALDPTKRIYELQREVLEFSRAVTPLVDVLKVLRTADHPVLNSELQHYVADTSDDLHGVLDQVNGDRELLHSALSANLTQVSIRQNGDMRKMSAVVAILAVPTMVAGIYGMNFDHMPELRSRYGYFVVLGGIAAVCLFLYARFKRSGWL